jgi:hypothetical protein
MNRAINSSMLFALLLLSGCFPDDSIVGRILPEDVDQFGRNLIVTVQRGEYSELVEVWLPSERASLTEAGFAPVSRHMQLGNMQAVVAATVFREQVEARTSYSVTYEVQYESGWQAVDVVLVQERDSLYAAGIWIHDLPASLKDLNAFTFSGKTPRHYVFFIVNLVYLGFVIFVFVICLRTRGLKRKWLWAFVTLLGVVQVTFNWTTGDLKVQLLSVGFMISGFIVPMPYIAKILYVYFPLGALLFLVKLARIRRAESASGECVSIT